MTTEQLKQTIEKWNPQKNTATDRFLCEIAYQLSRRTDLLEAQFEYDKQRDLDDDNHRNQRESLLADMGNSVKKGMNFIAPNPPKPPFIAPSPIHPPKSPQGDKS